MNTLIQLSRRVAKKLAPRFNIANNLLSSWKYRGDKLFCSFCERSFGRFNDYTGSYYLRGHLVDHFTKNALCPTCDSDIRHRFIFQFLKSKTSVFTAKTKFIHFAPESLIAKVLGSLPNVEYFPCDLNPEPGTKTLPVDMTKMSFADATFDAFLNVHVLEHIVDDQKAINELYRVLKPGGWGVIAIPTYGETTFEDPKLDAEGRTKMYGIDEHVRLNGLDFREKLKSAGFKVQIHSIYTLPGNYVDRDVSSAHMDSDKYLFYCEK